MKYKLQATVRWQRTASRVVVLILLVIAGAVGAKADVNKDLRKAAEKCNLPKVHQLLAKGGEVNDQDDKGVTALMLAAGKGCAEVVQALLDAGADAEAKDKNGLTAAMLAEQNGFSDIVKLLNKPRSIATAENVGEIPCSSIKMKSGEKSKQERFFTASEKRVKEVLIDAVSATGFVVKKDQGGHKLEATRRYPELGGGGAGGEKLKLNLEAIEQSGSSAIRVIGETKKRFAGRLRQHNWTDTVLDQAECLLSLFDLRTDDDILAEDTAPASGDETQSGQKIVLPDGVPIKLRLRRYLMARGSKEGQRIAFQVTDDVTVESRVVIKKGAIAWGQVTNAKGEGLVGRNAKLSFVIESVKAVDGQNIPVRSVSKDAGGGTSGSHITQGFLVAGGLGAIFSPGKQVGVRAGTEFVVFTKATKM